MQEFAVAVEQLSHRSLAGLSSDLSHRWVANASIDGVKDQDVQEYFFISSVMFLNVALK
jgi:hypothetical protein